MRAIQTGELGQASIVELPDPELRPGTIIVRPHFVGNNPCDFATIDIPYLHTRGQISGCDFAGVVEAVAPGVKTSLKPGDWVCGAMAAGAAADTTKGCFADLTPAYADFCWPIPKSITMAQAATLGVSVLTIGASLYDDFAWPLPEDDPNFGTGQAFFIYGGSTSTGLLAIQFAKLSGFRVITTCSPRNFDRVRARGADEVYDYHNLDECAKKIRDSVGDDLRYAYGCVNSSECPLVCSRVLSSKGGRYVTIAGELCPVRTDVTTIFSRGQSLVAYEFKGNEGVTKQTTKQRELGTRLFAATFRYLDEGKLQLPQIELRQGLEGALQGIDDLRHNLLSGRKIVSQLV